MRVKWNARRSVAAKPVVARSTPSVDPAGGSSSGRTADSDSANLGSNPSPPATICLRFVYLAGACEFWPSDEFDAARRTDDQQIGGARGKQSDRDHPGDLIDARLHRHRIGDRQIMNVENVVAVVGGDPLTPHGSAA